MAGLLVWLNGPGFPWLANKYGPGLLQKAGFEGDLQLSGSLFSGPNIDSINLTSETSPLKTLSATNLQLRYNLLDLKNLKIESLTADNLTVDLDLGQSSPKPKEEKEKEPSKATLKETLDKFRAIATYPEIQIRELNLHVHKGDQNFYRLQEASLAHAAQSDTFNLAPGTLTDFENIAYQPPTAEITWNEDSFDLVQLPLAQDFFVPDLRFQIEPLLVEGNLNAFGSVLSIDTDAQSKITAVLGEKTLDLEPILEIVPAAKDATCEITRFEASAANLNQEFSQWALDLKLTLDNLSFQNREIPETSLELLKDGLELDTTLSIAVPEQTQVLTVFTTFAPETAQAPGTAWQNSRSDVTTELQSLGSFLAGIAPALNLPVPPDGWPEGQALLLANLGIKDGKPSNSKLSLTFNRLNWAEAQFEKGELKVDYVDSASDIKADLVIEQSATSTLTSRASFNPNSQEYAATFSAKSFDAKTLQPFIRLSLGDFPLSGNITLDWQGTGSLPDFESHRGKLSLAQTRVTIDTQSPILLNLAAEYEGTKRVEISQLEVQQNDQILRTKALWNGQRVDLSEFSFTQRERQIATGKASVPLSLDTDFKNYLTVQEPWSAQFSIDRLDILETAELVGYTEPIPPDLAGILTFNLDVSGSPANPTARTGLILEAAQRLQANAAWDGERVEVSNFSLSQDQKQLVEGTMSLPLALDTDFKNYLTLKNPWDVKLNVDRLDVLETADLMGFSDKVPPQLDGILTLNLDIAGSPSFPIAETGLIFDGAQRLQANAKWNGERVEVSNLSLFQGEKKLVAGKMSLPLALDTDFKNYLELNDPWDVKFAVDRLDIPETAELAGFADKLPPNFEGVLTFNLDVTGSPKTPSVKSKLLFEAEQRLQADAAWDGERVTVSNLSLIQDRQPLVTGEISVPLSLDTDFKNYLALEKPWDVKLNIDTLDIPETAELFGQGSKLPEGLTGILSLDVNVAGSPAVPSLSGKLLLDGFSLENLSELPTTNAELNWATAGQTLTLDGTVKPEGRNALNITADTAFFPKKWAQNPDSFLDENFSAQIDAPDIQLAPFADLAPIVQSLDGTLVVQVRADGTFRKPNLTGDLDLDLPRANFDNERLRRVRKTSLKLDFANNKINIAPFSTTIDGGAIDVSGNVDLSDTSNPAFDIRANIDKALLVARRQYQCPWRRRPLPQGQLATSPYQRRNWHRRIPLLQGHRAPSSRRSRFYPQSPQASIGGQELPPTSGNGNTLPIPEPYANWIIDLKATTADPFLIRGNLTSGEVVGDLTATGTLANPELNGELVIKELSAALPFSTLTIEGGKAIFSPENGFIPALDIRAQSRIPPYQADLFVAGLATSPSVSFASNPPLPENEVITLLATGTTTEALEDSDAAKSKAFQLFIEQIRRAPPGSRLHPFAKIVEPLKDVELQIASADPFTGKRRNSATVPFPNSDRWFISASADSESNTRAFVLYILKFR